MNNTLLNCPITHDKIVDPITTPCGHTFSRDSLIPWFQQGKTTCPLCNTLINGFDPVIAPKNILVASLLEDEQSNGNPSDTHIWTSNIQTFYWNSKQYPLCKLNIELQNSKFKINPVLFIVVCDFSGSMSGKPTEQVKTALIHMASMVRNNPMVKLKLITYGSYAYINNLEGTESQVIETIKNLGCLGGTNFRSAFDKIKEILLSHRPKDDNENDPTQISNVIVSFLTDGQDQSMYEYSSHSNSKQALVKDFKTMLCDSWSGELTVHTIGFSRDCCRDLLEKMMGAGKSCGMFRYAEPQDDDDTLCQKLQGLFTIVSNSSLTKLHLKLNGLQTIDGSLNMEINIPINSNNKGKVSMWVKQISQNKSVNINSQLDTDININVVEEKINDEEIKQGLMDEWILKTIDYIAQELYTISQTNVYNKVHLLHCSLVMWRIEGIKHFTNTEDILNRLSYLDSQAESLLNNTISGSDISKLSDLRFGSNFGVVKTQKQNAHKSKVSVINNKIVSPTIAIKKEKEKYVHYSRCNDSKNRNEIQELITSLNTNFVSDIVHNVLDKTSIDDILYTDADGNNTVHLAAYCGQNYILENILDKFRDKLDVNIPNPHSETPLTLAVKGHGFWKSIKLLYKHGSKIPPNRKDILVEYAVDNGFDVTAKILSDVECSVEYVTHDMKPEYVEFLYDTAMERSLEINVQSYLEVSLAKGLERLVKTLLKQHSAEPNITMLLEYCIPPKPDHPDVDKYLNLLKIVLNHSPHLINDVNDDLESPLFKACEKGNLPHVIYLINRGAKIEQTNVLGNTPLWISCAKRYPCIIDELLKHGANVNHENHKGNPPLYGLCQKQYTPLKIVEKLLAARASVHSINSKTKDTLLLICCRNNKTDILKLFLDQVDEDFVKYKAEIDGFDAMMASVEANNPGCIQILSDYGIDLETPTDDTNPILARATPLHLGAYYNCGSAVNKLLQLGSNPNSKDINGQTPLHLAVIQGNTSMAQLLKEKGSDINMKDNFGSTPIMYCRNQKDIDRIFVHPVSKYLMQLASGHFTKSEEKDACQVLNTYGHQLGFVESSHVVNVQDQYGYTPLLKAVLASSYNIVKTIVQLGGDPNTPNNLGINSYFWVKWLNNPRIKQIVNNVTEKYPNKTQAQINLVVQSYGELSNNSYLFYLGSNIKDVETKIPSSLYCRMEYFDLIVSDTEFKPMDNKQSVTTYFDVSTLLPVLEKYDPIFSSLFRKAKIFVISTVANCEKKLSPYEIFSIYLYTSHPMLSNIIKIDHGNNKDLITEFKNALRSGIFKLEHYTGEVYIGMKETNRLVFFPSKDKNMLTLTSFISASSLWKVAVDSVPSFDDETKKGTIFIVKSKTGRYVGQYSEYMYDAEIIFLPGTKFRVTNWYRGDKICLGQANIREYTFGIKQDDELERMVNSNKSLIIELEEV